MRENDRIYGDFAVLYRTNAQSRVVEEMLLKSNIPYTMVGGHKFYDRKEIKDILAYLSLIANPDDSISLNELSMNQNEESVKVQLKNYDYLRIRMVGLCWKLPKMLIWQIFQEKRVKSLVILA